MKIDCFVKVNYTLKKVAKFFLSNKMSAIAIDQHLKQAISSYIIYLIIYVNSLIEPQIIKHT